MAGERDKVFIILMPDGHVMVSRPIPHMFDPESPDRQLLGMTFDDDAAVLDWISNRLLVQYGAASVRIADKADIPQDRTFRSAWADNGGRSIGVDMSKARDIHRNRLRDMRTPLLAALDIEYSRADERSDAAEKKRIADRKQALRDVTDDPAIDAATTPEELKAVLPAALRD